MRCGACGTENPDAARFCRGCGVELAGPSQPEGGPRRGVTAVVLVAASCLTALACLALFFLGWHMGRDSVLALSDVPDEAFRSYLQVNVDVNGNGSVSQEEAEAVTQMGDPAADDVSGNGLCELGITSLEGIERFPNLKAVVCSGNSIPRVDLSKNTALEQVVCNNSHVSEIVLPSCDSLHTVHASGNELANVDLSRNPGLSDVELDQGVGVTGGDFTDEAAKTRLGDLALLYLSSIWVEPEEPLPENLLDVPRTARLDSTLVYTAVWPVYLESEGLDTQSSAYGFAYEQVDDTFGRVSEETARAVIESVFGTAPEDMSYLSDQEGNYGFGTLVPVDGGWQFIKLYGPFSQSVEAENWVSYGRLVSFDVAFTAISNPDYLSVSTLRYHVVALEDEGSAFGYHLVFAGASSEEQPQASEGALGADASDEELLAHANAVVDDMYRQVYGMALGAAYDQDWSRQVVEDGVTWFLVTGCSSLQELEERWHQSFSSAYSIEEATGAPLAYREIDGALYSSNGGIGDYSTDFELTGVVSRGPFEVVFEGVAVDRLGGSESPIEMSLVFEGDAWKYGRWIETSSSGSGGSGETGQPDEPGQPTEQPQAVDYEAYLLDQLREKGLLHDGNVTMVSNETDTELTVSVGDNAPGKITFHGHYTLDKGDLTIFDETFQRYV